MKSTTCRGSNNQFLEEYHTLAAAELAAKETKERYSRDVVATKCPTCGYWHLRMGTTRRQCMFCKDSGLFLKDVYSTREEASKIAAWLWKEKKVKVQPYKCPHGSGWHLTKS